MLPGPHRSDLHAPVREIDGVSGETPLLGAPLSKVAVADSWTRPPTRTDGIARQRLPAGAVPHSSTSRFSVIRRLRGWDRSGRLDLNQRPAPEAGASCAAPHPGLGTTRPGCPAAGMGLPRTSRSTSRVRSQSTAACGRDLLDDVQTCDWGPPTDPGRLRQLLVAWHRGRSSRHDDAIERPHRPSRGAVSHCASAQLLEDPPRCTPSDMNHSTEQTRRASSAV